MSLIDSVEEPNSPRSSTLNTLGIMEKKMETVGIIGVILRLYWDTGKENGNQCNISLTLMVWFRVQSGLVGFRELGGNWGIL